ncbi:MAG TPA: PRC and DUF2382 domain-containing protein [Propionibacteriaceae bacterium]|jgi:uncharacterized protein (TIGR02271 family)|nr:PRC and DUF2382 domain-containing protein [Propionibacteriaceae bacterium]
MPFSKNQLDNLVASNGNVVNTDGQKIGGIGTIYLDDTTGEPEWVTVKTGLFGASQSFVPLRGADVVGNDIQVDYDKDVVKDAPRIDADGDLTPEQEQQLYQHYGLTSATSSGYTAGDVDDDRDRDAVGYDTSGPTTDDAMTRSEERLNVGTRSQEAGRARLRKYVVTENVTQTVPVSREEVRVEREPITDANVGAARSGPEISEEEHEVILREERPVVEKEAVPVERVRLGTETVTDQETVSEEVRKEQIDTDINDERNR